MTDHTLTILDAKDEAYRIFDKALGKVTNRLKDQNLFVTPKDVFDLAVAEAAADIKEASR